MPVVPRIQGVLGLRTTTVAVAVVLVAMAAVVSVTLVLLTTWLREQSNDLVDSVASVRLAEEAEIDLLIHDRLQDHVARVDVENDLRRKLRDAQLHVTSREERTALAEASAAAEAYLAVLPEPGTADDRAESLDAAYGALERLVDVNVAQAEATLRESSRMDRLGNIVGWVAGVAMLTTVVALVVWMRVAVVRPTLEIADAMERFKEDGTSAGAPAIGARELRVMANRFNDMARSIAQQHRARLDYVAGVAHDLRDPLAALHLVALQSEDSTHSEAQARRMSSVLRRQVSRLDRMVEDLLEAARIEAGQLSLRRAEVDLGRVVRDAVDQFAGISPLHSLEVVLPDEPLVVRCDADRIEQVLSNLLSNAIKYSPRGGVVAVTARTTDGDAEVSVSDPGVGMTDDDMAHLFAPYARRGASKETIAGVGLGLFVVKRVIEAHGGTVAVRSTPGRGSTFTFRLPVGLQAQAATTHGAGATSGPASA